MIYNKTIWNKGDLISSAKLNNLEEGLNSLYELQEKEGILYINKNYDIDNTGVIPCGSIINQAITDALEILSANQGRILDSRLKALEERISNI